MLYCFFVYLHFNQESWLEDQDSGFRNRAIKHSLNTRQLILGYRGSTKMHKTIGTPPCTLRHPWVSVYMIQSLTSIFFLLQNIRSLGKLPIFFFIIFKYLFSLGPAPRPGRVMVLMCLSVCLCACLFACPPPPEAWTFRYLLDTLDF